MPSTNFIDKQTIIQAEWLNAVNTKTYTDPVPVALAASSGASLVGYMPGGAGAIPTTVQAKLSECVSTFSFMTTDQIADVQAGTLGHDVTAALNAWFSHLSITGGFGFVNPGTYKVSSALSCGLTKSIEVRATGAKFVAASGFAAGNKMVSVQSSIGGGHSFKWIGGDFDAVNQPNSLPGTSCDIFSVNTDNGSCSHCHVELDKTYSGSSWLSSGSDSHLFIGGPSNIIAKIHNCTGAKDSGIYISRNFDADEGECLEASGNFYRCSVGIIIKRSFKTANVKANLTECRDGVGVGTADSSGAAITHGGSGYIFEVNAKLTENAVFLQAVDGVTVTLQSEDMGVSIPGYASAGGSQLVLLGATNVKASINIHRVNQALITTSAFLGVTFSPITITAGTLQSTDNDIDITCSSIGRSFAETNLANRNYIRSRESNILVVPALTGNLTTWTRNNIDSATMEFVGPAFSIGGKLGSEAVRVGAVASQVNLLSIVGSASGAVGGPIIATTGLDANIPLTITTIGTGAIYLGGLAGAESLRVSKVASQTNSVRLTGSAAGSPVALAAGGGDASIDLSLSGKGPTGTIRMLAIQNFADDTAAAAFGIAVGGIYRTGSILKIRVV